jgi:hypothetical protein
MKEKKERFPYKHLTLDDFNALKAKSDEDLLKDHLFESKAIQIISKQAKENKDLKDLRRKIKEHRDASDDLVKAKAEVVKAREEADAEIEDIIVEKKKLDKDYRDDKIPHKEKVKAVQYILEGRKMNRPS